MELLSDGIRYMVNGVAVHVPIPGRFTVYNTLTVLGITRQLGIRLADAAEALKTVEGRKTLDGHIYKEFKNGEVLVKELTDGEMPEAYAVFGLKY